MLVEKQYQCKYCQTVLKGRVKASRVEKNYISITGMVTLQLWDEDSSFRSYQFISDRPVDQEPPQLHFCDTPCFDAYIKYKRKEYEEHRKDKLRKEASEAATFPRYEYDNYGNRKV